MRKILTLGFVCLMSFPLWGQTQPASANSQISPPSLGEVARKLRAEEKKENPRNVKVYTNDNLPRGGGGLSVVGPATPAVEAANPGPSAAEPGPTGPHGEEYFRSHMAMLQQRLETDQRELSVLRQKLAQSNMQYYPDPTKALMQEYSRSNIGKLTSQIDEKKQQITEDEQVIQDLRVQLAREGGEPGWVEAGNRGWATDIQAAKQTQLKADSKAPLGDQLKDANQALANAKEQERLAENELSLLQLQQARELNPGVQADVASKIDAKQAEIAAAKAAIEQAQKRIDEINQEIQKRQKEEGQKSHQ
ncbi:MAG: hypothetical protein ACRD3T_11090 [Terriglobia bacterium]